MANRIIPKKSSVASKVPLATDLSVGEIAINLADKLIYTKDAGGTVVTIGGSSGGTSLPDQTGNTGKYLKTDGSTASWSALPSVLSILNRSAASVSVSVGNGLLAVLNRSGSIINVAVS